MGSVYDVERMLFDIDAFLKVNFGPKILSINAEKADSVTLEVPAIPSYAVQYFDGQVNNYKVAVISAIETFPTPVSIGPATGTFVSVLVAVIVADSDNDLSRVRRLLRYQRGLRELFESNWASVGGNIKFKVSSLAPVTMDLARSTPDHAIGIILEGNIP